MQIDGLAVAYREAGPPEAPTVLLLHGFPSSSRMYQRLFPLLSDRYHLVAPDYVGFGHSDAPDPAHFDYTFDHLADIVAKMVGQMGVTHYPCSCRTTAARSVSGWRSASLKRWTR